MDINDNVDDDDNTFAASASPRGYDILHEE